MICLRITLHLYVHDSFLFIDISAIYFSEKQADGRSSKDFLFPVILAIVFAVIGMYLIFMWRKEICHFFRKKDNIIIEVHVIYCGFISFSGHDFHWVIENHKNPIWFIHGQCFYYNIVFLEILVLRFNIEFVNPFKNEIWFMYSAYIVQNKVCLSYFLFIICLVFLYPCKRNLKGGINWNHLFRLSVFSSVHP